MAEKLKIRLSGSRIGRTKAQRKVLDGLGLKKRGHTVEREDTPAIRGMISKVSFLLSVEEL